MAESLWQGSLRRFFATALEWYTHLNNKVDEYFDEKLEEVREEYLATDEEDQEPSSGSSTPRGRSPSAAASSRTPSPSPTPPTDAKSRWKAQESCYSGRKSVLGSQASDSPQRVLAETLSRMLRRLET